MNKTSIEWVKNPDGTQGYTWNPITGCLNGCEYCYARKLANERLRTRYLANVNVAPIELSNHPSKLAQYSNRARLLQTLDPFYPRFWQERISQPLREQKNSGIFVCDMGELFGDWVPKAWQEWIFSVIKSASWHRFYLLTKQPQNLIKFSPFPDNCFVGVSATDNKMFNYALVYLSEIEARVKFVSLEPLLGRIEPVGIGSSILDWLIIGSQTKPYRPPTIEAVQEIVEACVKAGIPVFLKDNLKPLLEGKGRPFYKDHYQSVRMDESNTLAISTLLRQEMPTP